MSQYPLLVLFVCFFIATEGKDSSNRAEGLLSRRLQYGPTGLARVSQIQISKEGVRDTHSKNHNNREYTRDGDEEKNKNSRNAFLRSLQDNSLQSTNSTILNTNAVVASDLSLVPTTFVTSTYTHSSTLSPAYVCNPDPENCGCPNLHQSDYRGSINTTKSGKHCARWNNEDLNNWYKDFYSEDIFQSYSKQEFPNAGPEDNFCRNLDDDPGGPWCFPYDLSGTWDWEMCDVPMCDSSPTSSPSTSFIPSSSSRPTLSKTPSLSPTFTEQPSNVPSSSPSLTPSSSSAPTKTCQMVADKSKCGCEVVYKSDFRGTISTTKEGLECAKWTIEGIGMNNERIQEAGLDENYCRNPVHDASGPGCFPSLGTFGEDGIPIFLYCDVPACDPCSCMPECGQPNLSNCGCPSALQAEECCDEDDSECRCQHLKDACHVSIKNNGTDFCAEAEVACCSNKFDLNCKCAMYEQMCFEYPSDHIFEFAAASCCNSFYSYGYGVPETCFCDFYTSIKSTHEYESEYSVGNCTKSKEVIGDVTQAGNGDPSEVEGNNLLYLYEDVGGVDWYDNTGWSDGSTPHCQWFGISCDEDGLVTKINLRNNNLKGKAEFLFWSITASFKELKVLDVAENYISGFLPSILITTFAKLEHIDISNNGIWAGNEYNNDSFVDMAFPSSTAYVNYSHNQFSGVSFKRFNAAYETLKVLDLSNNNINQDLSTIFYNIPPNIQELFLSSNLIKGKLPDPFPLETIISFAIAKNNIDGTLPNFPKYTLHLRELDLSDQKGTNGGGLSGMIPIDIYKLVGLSTLNLANNNLSGDIPQSIGNIPKLKMLNLSSNVLGKQIPSELGRLKGACFVLLYLLLSCSQEILTIIQYCLLWLLQTFLKFWICRTTT